MKHFSEPDSCVCLGECVSVGTHACCPFYCSSGSARCVLCVCCVCVKKEGSGSGEQVLGKDQGWTSQTTPASLRVLLAHTALHFSQLTPHTGLPC